jgi:hypothetical protein
VLQVPLLLPAQPNASSISTMNLLPLLQQLLLLHQQTRNRCSRLFPAPQMATQNQLQQPTSSSHPATGGLVGPH